MASPAAVAFYLEIVSRKRRGVFAALLRAILRLAALFYGLALALRSAFYAAGLFRTARAPCPVLSVGNVVAGGTGKTPMVEHLARRLGARGRRPAVVARGYRGAGRGSAAGGERNDEALALEAALPGVPQVLDADRVRGARTAAARHGADCVVLDDGFQHRRIARDLDLVLIDALQPFGHGHLLPRGLLREPLAALARADAVAITRADLCPPARLAEIRAAVERAAPGRPVLEVVEEATGLGRVAAAGAAPAEPPERLRGRKVFAFCGIGNPANFFARLERLGADLAGRLAFPDHHAYGPADVGTIERAAAAARAEWVLTTRKDAVKLGGLLPPALAERVFVLEIRAAVRSGEADLERLIDRALAPAAARAPAAPAAVALAAVGASPA